MRACHAGVVSRAGLYPQLSIVSLMFCLHLPVPLGPGLRSALAEPLLSEQAVSLGVSPTTCVALHKGQHCFQQLTLSWRTPTGYRLCLFGDSSGKPLHCTSAALTEFKHEYRSKTAESFVLRQGESGPVVSQISVTTAWVYRTGKRSSSGWRLF